MGPEVLSLVGILLGLAVLIVLAFRGFNSTVITIAATIVVALFSRQSIVTTFTDRYMAGFAGFLQGYFPVLLISAIFASLMQHTGAIHIIGNAFVLFCKRLIPQKYIKFGVVCISGTILSGLLTYGGINLFVLAFLLYPLSRTMFEKLDIPWHLVFCGTLGSATFTMGYLPGSPQIQNLIPVEYLGTTPMAGPILGLIATVITVVLGTGYIWYVVARTERRGEGFMETGAAVAAAMPPMELADTFAPMDLIRALVPILVMIVMMLNEVNVLVCMAAAIAVLAILFFPRFKDMDIRKMLGEGTTNGVNASVSTGCIIAFGTVVQFAPGFAFVTSLLMSIPVPPMVQYLIAVEVAAGICGSSSGGVALGSFGQKYLAMGLDPAAMHRLGAIASCGLDSLPHTSGIYMSLAITRLTHKQAYQHQFWLTVVIPIITVAIVAAIYMSTGIL